MQQNAEELPVVTGYPLQESDIRLELQPGSSYDLSPPAATLPDLPVPPHNESSVRQGSSSKRGPKTFCRWLVRTTVYKGAIFGLSIITAIFLATFSRTTPPPWQDFYVGAEYFISIFFILDPILKLVAYGFHGYFMNSWCVVEILIFTAAVVWYATAGFHFHPNFNAVRILIIMRYIPCVPVFREAKLLGRAFVESARKLFDVLIIVLYFQVMCAVIGMDYFARTFRYRCADENEYVCDTNPNPHGLECNANVTCTQFDANPNANSVSFDLFPVAMLTVFRIMTVEGWSENMQAGMGARGPIAAFYFIAIVIIGSYVLIQLMPAVLTGKLVELASQKQQLKEEQELLEKANADSQTDAGLAQTASSSDSNNGAVPGTEFAPVSMHVANGANGNDDVNPHQGDHTSTNGISLWVPSDGASRAADAEGNSPSRAVQNGGNGVAQKSNVHAGGGYDDGDLLDYDSDTDGDEGDDLVQMEQHGAWHVKNFFHMIHTPIYKLVMRCAYALPAVLIISSSYGDDPHHFEFDEAILQLLFWIFWVDIIMQLAGTGPRKFFTDGLNVFNTVITIISTINFITYQRTGPDALRVINVLFVFRIPLLTRFANIFKEQWPLIRAFFAIWLLVMLMFAEIGVQLFSGYIPESESLTFSNIGGALLVVFQIFSIENWNDLETAIVESHGTLWAELYLVITLVCGGYILSQMLLAIIVSGFQDVLSNEITKEHTAPLSKKEIRAERKRKRQDARARAVLQTYLEDPLGHPIPDSVDIYWGPLGPVAGKLARELNDYVDETHPTGVQYQAMARRLDNSFIWKGAFCVCSLASFIVLYITPVSMERYPNQWLWLADLFLASLFIVELVVKIVAHGPKQFFKNGWDLLVLICVCGNIIGLVAFAVGWERFRLLRLIRVFWLFTLSVEMRVTLLTVVGSLPVLGTILIPYAFYVIIFSCIGLTLFQGKLYSCTADADICPEGSWDGTCNVDKSNCPEGWWRPYRFVYDDVYSAFLSVAVISFQEGWPDDMARIMNIDLSEDCRNLTTYHDASPPYHDPGLECAPVHLASSPFAIFNCLAEFVGQWLLVTLVMGAMLDNIKRVEAKIRGHSVWELNSQQKVWYRTAKKLVAKKVAQGYRWQTCIECRKSVARWLNSKPYRILMQTIVLLDIVGQIILVPYEGNNIGPRGEEDSNLALTLNMIFFSLFRFIYTADLTLRWIGLGTSRFLASGWNTFPLILEVMEWVFFGVYTGLGWGDAPAILTLARGLRLIRYQPPMMSLFRTMSFGAMKILSTLLLMLWMVFAYGQLGHAVFADVDWRQGSGDVNYWVNFATLEQSMLTVFVCSTGENWPGVMADIMTLDHPYAWFFFISMYVVFNLGLVNIIAATVVDTYLEMLENTDQIWMAKEFSRRAMNAWSKYDTDHDKWIDSAQIIAFIYDMRDTLVSVGITMPEAYRLLSDTVVYDNQVSFLEVMHPLLSKFLGTDLPQWAHLDILETAQDKHRCDRYIDAVHKVPFRIVLASLSIQRTTRGYLVRKTLERMGLVVTRSTKILVPTMSTTFSILNHNNPNPDSNPSP